MNLNELKFLLKKYQLDLKSNFGQNFLIEPQIIEKIINSAQISADDFVLEIGPGLGPLTSALATTVKKVLAVEFDRQIFPGFLEQIKNFPNIIPLNQDILKLSNSQIKEFLDNSDYCVIANLPYSITAKILRKFLELKPKPKKMILMVQKEVGERICSLAGKQSLLSLSVQVYATPKILFYVSKNNFFPVPKVDSCVVEIAEINDNIVYQGEKIDEISFFRLLRISFASRRKTLINNLDSAFKLGKKEWQDILNQLSLESTVRAQELTLTQWFTLYNQIKNTILEKK